jgi:WD40 repeat protein
VRAQERAEAESYSATLIAANLQLRAGETDDARAKLANTSPALRGWEWRHLMALTDQSIATIYVPDLLGPQVHVHTQEMRFSEDGAQLFSYGNGFLRSWDLATKHMVTDLSGLGRILAVGPYGRTVLVGPQLDIFADLPPEGFDLRLYDVSSRQVLSVLRGMNGNSDEAAISADGGLVAVALDNTDIFKDNQAPIMVWNAHTGEVTARLEGHPRAVTSLRFSPDGRLLASASLDRTVQLWHLASRRKAITLRHESGVGAISFSSDGRLLASGSREGKICIWDTGTGQLQRVWNASGQVRSVEFSPDASMLATSSGGAIRLWESRTGRLAQDLGDKWEAYALAFHPVAPRLYSAADGVIKEWDLSGHGAVIDDAKVPVRIAVSPNGRWLASASSDGKLRIYDAASANLLRAWSAHTGPVSALAFSPDSETVASGSLDAIKIWRVPDGQLLRTMTGHTDLVWSVAFHPDGRRLISSSRDLTIRVWQMTSSAPPVIIPTTDISRVAVSHDGRIIMALRSSDKAILLWDAETKQSLGTLSSETTDLSPVQPRSFALSRDDQILVAPADTGSAIAIWDFPRRRLLRILTVLRGGNGIDPIVISPDGSRIAVGGVNSGSLSVWDLRNGLLLVTLSGHNLGLNSLAWSQDGARLFSASNDGTIRIWDSRSPHNFEAELLLDKISDRCLLVEEVTQELNADSTLSPELRREAIQLATERGNANYFLLLSKADVTSMAQNRSTQEYMQALRRAYAGTQVVPWMGEAYPVLALLQYRTGDFDKALVSAQRAMEIQKSQSVDAHAVRAMAYYRLHDTARARSEAVMARQSAKQFGVDGDHPLLQEAEALVGK